MNFTRSILFAIVLTGLVHITVSKPSSSKWKKFLQRLEKDIEIGTPDILPFLVKNNVIGKLNETSDRFKELCIGYDADAKKDYGKYSPVESLKKAIHYVFLCHKFSPQGMSIRRILSEIYSVDPIGLHVYLTKKNVDHISSSFTESVMEFRETTYKMEPIKAGSEYCLSDFLEFIQRLENSTDILPFTLQIRVAANLWATSEEFKELCVDHETESKLKNGDFAPVSSLKETIEHIYYEYKERAEEKKNVMKYIQKVDPIGFHVYLEKKKTGESTSSFIRSVEEFRATLASRVRLSLSRADDSFIEILDENPSKDLFPIPDNVRKEITTEYKFLNHETIDFFTKIAMEHFPHIRMYSSVTYHFEDNFEAHSSKKTDDVQILYGGELNSTEPGHAICIFYNATRRKPIVYDSFDNEPDPKQENIILKLYPFSKRIVYEKPKNRQTRNTKSCAVFAITYATMLLLGVNPAEHEIEMNYVHGDESLYMRLHILKMFANRRLALMN